MAKVEVFYSDFGLDSESSTASHCVQATASECITCNCSNNILLTFAKFDSWVGDYFIEKIVEAIKRHFGGHYPFN